MRSRCFPSSCTHIKINKSENLRRIAKQIVIIIIIIFVLSVSVSTRIIMVHHRLIARTPLNQHTNCFFFLCGEKDELNLEWKETENKKSIYFSVAIAHACQCTAAPSRMRVRPYFDWTVGVPFAFRFFAESERRKTANVWPFYSACSI